MPRARGKQTSAFCIISLLNAGYMFSEQSLVLGRQTVQLTEAPTVAVGPRGPWHSDTYIWQPRSSGEFESLRSLPCWYYWGLLPFDEHFPCKTGGIMGAAICALLQQLSLGTKCFPTLAGLWLRAQEDQTSEQGNRIHMEANLLK